MYKPATAFLALTLIGAMSTACSESTSPVSPSSTSEVVTSSTNLQASGTWSLISLQRAGEATQTAPAGATYTLTLDDNRASTRADCNMCGGSFTVAGQLVTIGPNLACTRAACPTMAFESVYESILSGESTASLEGNTLTLTSSRGRLVFTH